MILGLIAMIVLIKLKIVPLLLLLDKKKEFM